MKVNFDGTTLILSSTFLCGGTLLNQKTALTAAHCINTQFEYDYKGRTYMIEIKPNEYYSTWESMFTVYIGMHNSNINSELNNNKFGKAIYVAKIIKVLRLLVELILFQFNIFNFKHESYDETNVLNDLAILKLNDVVNANQDVQFACLPRNFSTISPPLNSPAWVVGWGTTSIGGEASNVLRNIKIQVYNSNDCSKVSYEKVFINELLYNNMYYKF